MSDDEVRRLRACLRDLVALAALPGVWVGRSRGEIVVGLLDAVRSMLRLDLLYVRVGPAGSADSVEAAISARADIRDRAAMVGTLIADAVTERIGEVVPLASPIDGGPLWALGLPLGFDVERGLLVAAHGRPDFPSDTDRLLLSVAASQAVVALQGARLLTENARLAHEAREANKMKDEFLATLSHELRTPLSAVLAWARLLRTGVAQGAAAERALETIERNAVAQAKLVDDLLDISRIVSGKLSVELRPVALAPIVDAAMNAIAAAAESRRVTLERWLDNAVPPVLGDADRLQQVVANLLSNAVKFTSPGDRIDVVLRSRNGEAEIVVSDTGQGIDPRFLPQVFDRFRQSDASSTRRSGGLGLGLAIVRHLVEAHGGAVVAQSDGPGRGARFTVKLPLLDGVESRPAEHRAPEDVAARLDHRHVLLVDDDAASLEVLAFVMRHCGARVTTATSVAEALTAVTADPPDAVVSDVGMPGRDGYAFIQELRRMDAAAGRRTPAMALTAFAGWPHLDRLLAAGFDRYVAKPADPSDLARELATLLARASGPA